MRLIGLVQKETKGVDMTKVCGELEVNVLRSEGGKCCVRGTAVVFCSVKVVLCLA